MTDLNPRFVLGDLDLTDYPFAVEFGSDLGNPQNAAEVVDSLLTDGEIIGSSRTSNRTITIPVMAEGLDMQSLAVAEAALVAECDKQTNELTVAPGDDVAAQIVFSTFRAQLTFSRDDDEESALIRRYVLSIPALPWAMSTADVLDVALTAGVTPATSTIADGTSATGWTAVDGTVTASGGVLHVPSHVTASTFTPNKISSRTDQIEFAATKTLAAFNFATLPYLSMDVIAGTPSAGSASTPFQVYAYVDGVQAPVIATQNLGSKTLRVTVLSSDASASTLKIVGALQVYQSPVYNPGLASCEFQVDNVVASNTPPATSTTGRETLRQVSIQGSARTSGRMAIEHETAALGDVILYSRPSLGASSTPDLRRWRTTGSVAPTADTGIVSGAREVIGTASATATVFQVPASTLPRGGYLIYARVNSSSGTSARVLSASASTKVGATVVGVQTITSDAVTLSTGSNNYQIVPIGEVVLPPAEVPDGSSALVEIRIWSTSGNVQLDEAFAFYAGAGSALTIVHAGDAASPAVGTAHNRLWLDTPSLDRPEYSIWLGTQADRSDAFFGGQFADGWGTHELPAGDALFFLVNTGTATYPNLSVSHRPRWWLHAGRIA